MFLLFAYFKRVREFLIPTIIHEDAGNESDYYP